MTTRPTTLVESDQLAQAAANIIRNEALVPKAKRWPFSRSTKAQREYERAVQEITARRRAAREQAVEQKIKKERTTADALFERARAGAQGVYDSKIAEAKKPYNETESEARRERDAAIAAANQAYQQAMEKANRIYQQEASGIDRERDAAIAEAKAVHDESYAILEEQRKLDLAQIAKDMKTIPLEGPMRIVEDREAWSPDERRKALIGIVDMAGREDFGIEYVDLCLRNVAGYVYQDRYLKADEQQHRLMDVNLLEALVDLALRTPERRPTVVKYMHEIVVHNPGHTSAAFIKTLTELYVAASGDTKTIYDENLIENEKIFDLMRAHIADTLKLTPRRSQIPAPPASGTNRREPAAADGDDQQTPVMLRPEAADITADVDVSELVPVESAEAAEAKPAPESAPPASQPASDPPAKPAGPRKRSGRAPVPEGTT